MFDHVEEADRIHARVRKGETFQSRSDHPRESACGRISTSVHRRLDQPAFEIVPLDRQGHVAVSTADVQHRTLDAVPSDECVEAGTPMAEPERIGFEFRASVVVPVGIVDWFGRSAYDHDPRAISPRMLAEMTVQNLGS